MGSQRRRNKRAPRTRGPESLVLGSIERDERPRDLQRRQGSRSTTNRYTWLREQTKSTRRKGCSNQRYLPVLSFLRHPFFASMQLLHASPLFQEFLSRVPSSERLSITRTTRDGAVVVRLYRLISWSVIDHRERRSLLPPEISKRRNVSITTR